MKEDNNYEITRSVPLAIFRISSLLLIIITLIYFINYESSADGKIHSNSFLIEGEVNIETINNETKINLSNFKCTNCPIINLQLSKNEKIKDSINLGKLLRPIGNQKYDIPKDINLNKYDTLIFVFVAENRSIGYAKFN